MNSIKKIRTNGREVVVEQRKRIVAPAKVGGGGHTKGGTISLNFEQRVQKAVDTMMDAAVAVLDCTTTAMRAPEPVKVANVPPARRIHPRQQASTFLERRFG